jgi:NO-binding membrane sensor protein with MHYT domain
MPGTHELWLVAVSIVVAAQGVYVGLTLAMQVGEANGLRRALVAGSSCCSRSARSNRHS